MRKIVKDHAFEHLPDDEAGEIESKLWWINGRKNIIRAYLNTFSSKNLRFKIMDVGCGSGGNFDVLSEYGEVYNTPLNPDHGLS
jgi:hypothetical protein